MASTSCPTLWLSCQDHSPVLRDQTRAVSANSALQVVVWLQFYPASYEIQTKAKDTHMALCLIQAGWVSMTRRKHSVIVNAYWHWLVIMPRYRMSGTFFLAAA